MVYLAKFLTVVMHAGFSGDNRHNLVERAKQSFLRDMQVVIVEGGPNNGKLVDHKFDNANTTSSSKKAKHPDEFFQDFNSQKSFVEYWNSSWGYGTDSLGVISHRNAHGKHRKLFTVTYPDNPGCTVGPVQLSRKHKVSPADLKKECDKQPVSQPSYVRLSKYYGAQKPVVGIWIANKTFPDTAWTMVMDDDNAMIPSRVADWLVGLDPDVPLLLTGLVGPVATHIKCHARVNQTNWGCCTDPRYPCRSYVKGHKQSIWSWNKDKQTFEVTKQCADNQLSSECCKAEPWPEGEKYRYPFKASATGTSFSPHFANLWPYGGMTYILSRGLLNSIDSDYWTHCMFALQCANADHRVMTCVLNAGYTPTFIGGVPTVEHHVSEPQEQCFSPYTFGRDEEGKLELKMTCMTKPQCDLEAESDAWSATRVSFGNASNSNAITKKFGHIPINATNQLKDGITPGSEARHHGHHHNAQGKGDSTATTEASPTHSQHHADHSVLKFNLPAAT